jgi:hypothetical protein
MASINSQAPYAFSKSVSAGVNSGVSSVTINDPLVTPTSIILGVSTTPASSYYIVSITPAAGSFTIRFNTTIATPLNFVYVIISY